MRRGRLRAAGQGESGPARPPGRTPSPGTGSARSPPRCAWSPKPGARPPWTRGCTGSGAPWTCARPAANPPGGRPGCSPPGWPPAPIRPNTGRCWTSWPAGSPTGPPRRAGRRRSRPPGSAASVRPSGPASACPSRPNSRCCDAWWPPTAPGSASSARWPSGCGPTRSRCSRCSAPGSTTRAACRAAPVPTDGPVSPTSPTTCCTPTGGSPWTSWPTRWPTPRTRGRTRCSPCSPPRSRPRSAARWTAGATTGGPNGTSRPPCTGCAPPRTRPEPGPTCCGSPR